jgi:hypothetical protein
MAKQTIGIGTTANDGTGDTVRAAFDKTNDNTNELYNLLGDGSTLSITGDVSVSAGAVTIADDSVSFEKVDAEFTTSSALTAGATVDVDYDTAQVFTLTPNANTTFNITNPKIGVTKTLIVTGAGSSYTADTWTVGGGAGTFNRIAGEYDDTSSTKNFYQITCISATEFWYSISQIAS